MAKRKPARKSAAQVRLDDARRQREINQASRIVEIPKCADRRRRKRLEADTFAWLRWYAADVFTRDFTDQQREMILAIGDVMENGGDQSEAASRGEGKTTIAERVLGKNILTGRVHFAVLFKATGTDAEHSLQSIKTWLETNPRLAADYPEVIIPLRALESTPQRAHFQLVTGHRHDNGRKFAATPSKFKWCGREIILPRVPGSPSSGAIIATRGLDGAVRGLKIDDCRPDICVIDDPDTLETINSEEQRDKLEAKINKAIGGLGGQNRTFGRVMLTTIQRRGSASDRYTDPKMYASWRGKRFKFLVTPPDRTDLWDEYISLRVADLAAGTTTAAQFIDTNFELMHLGAVVGNPYRTPGGQRSALQFYYDEVVRIGWDAVRTELDNDPPEESGPVESGITPHRIQRQLSGFDRLIVPPKCTVITAGIDVRKVGLHWSVWAWENDFTGYCIAYGVHETSGTQYKVDDGVDIAIERATLDLHEQLVATEFMKENGEILPLAVTLIDSGWQTQALYSACAKIGPGIYPSRGHGKSAGCTQANFYDVQNRTRDRRPGDGWFLTREGKIWLAHIDSDRYKVFTHSRFMTAPGKPGCFYLHGTPSDDGGKLNDDERSHHSFARHICSEVEVEELIKGVLRRRFKAKSENNHWLDSTVLAVVGASMKGIKLPLIVTAKPAKILPKHTAAVGAGGATVATTGKKYFHPADLVREANKTAWR